MGQNRIDGGWSPYLAGALGHKMLEEFLKKCKQEQLTKNS